MWTSDNKRPRLSGHAALTTPPAKDQFTEFSKLNGANLLLKRICSRMKREKCAATRKAREAKEKKDCVSFYAECWYGWRLIFFSNRSRAITSNQQKKIQLSPFFPFVQTSRFFLLFKLLFIAWSISTAFYDYFAFLLHVFNGNKRRLHWKSVLPTCRRSFVNLIRALAITIRDIAGQCGAMNEWTRV